MPLLDHFHPPISHLQPWESFHTRWAVQIADYLNRILPRRYAAEVQIHLGRQAEADVAEYDRGFADGNGEVGGGSAAGGVALQTQSYAPPAAATMAATFPDDLEVYVNDVGAGGSRLLAVIELVSPANKDRFINRQAFAIKTAAYLQRGIGVVTLDIVTEKHFNLHNEFVRLMRQADPLFMPPDAHVYATAYRPARRNDENQIDVWTFPLAVGQPLPTVPLALRATTTVPLDLESTYAEARRNSRLD
jgi:hypothetical protein